MIYREAQLTDIEQLSDIRLSVKENRLSNPGLVTHQDYETFLTIRGKGWVAEIDSQIVGFAIADLEGHNIWALFIHPDYEGMGIGRKLHQLMLGWYFTQTQQTVWLSTAPQSRAAVFYRKAGWEETGVYGKEEIKFEMSYQHWLTLPISSVV